jgi:hypothetical protein
MNTRNCFIGILVVVALALIFHFKSSTTTRATDIEKTRAFNSLLKDWTLTLTGVHNVVQYERRATGSEWGTVLEYFKLELTDGDVEMILKHPQFHGPFEWMPAEELLPLSRSLSWWPAGNKMKHYTATFLSTDRVQFVRFYLFTDPNHSYMLVESLSRKDEVKQWRTK